MGCPPTRQRVAHLLDESIGFLVHQADLYLVNHQLSLFKLHHVTAEQWKVLSLLVETDGLTQRELARKNSKDPTTLVRILDKMEKKGLVERRHHPGDRRVFRITLTTKGRKLQERLAPLAVRSSEDATQGMSKTEVRTLKRLLRQVHANLAPLREETVGEGSVDDVLAAAEKALPQPRRARGTAGRQGCPGPNFRASS